MPLWVRLFWVLVIGFNSFVLWRAWKRKYFKYGPIIYSLDEGPAYFWFFAFVFTATELFSVGMLALAVASSTWGPVFHQ